MAWRWRKREAGVAAATTTEIGLVVVGRPSSRWWQRPIPCRVELDGDSVGSVAHHGELAVMVRPGQHVVSAGIWRARTTGYPFLVDQDATVYVDVVPNRYPAIRRGAEPICLRFGL
jgi:hypothetical protein